MMYTHQQIEALTNINVPDSKDSTKGLFMRAEKTKKLSCVRPILMSMHIKYDLFS